jgi:hypothetical protein
VFAAQLLPGIMEVFDRWTRAYTSSPDFRDPDPPC